MNRCKIILDGPPLPVIVVIDDIKFRSYWHTTGGIYITRAHSFYSTEYIDL